MAEGSSSFAQPCIPKYDRDYDHWSLLMENLLRSKDFWGVIETDVSAEEADGLTAEQKKTRDDLKLKDLKAKNYLFASIDKTILKTISKKATAKDIWDSMKLKCQGNARVKKAQLNRLRRSFKVLMMKQGESITDYFNRVMIIANEMRMLYDCIREWLLLLIESKLHTHRNNFPNVQSKHKPKMSYTSNTKQAMKNAEEEDGLEGLEPPPIAPGRSSRSHAAPPLSTLA
ncbi:unnamed protein product [Rhodiola kirilowii]